MIEFGLYRKVRIEMSDEIHKRESHYDSIRKLDSSIHTKSEERKTISTDQSLEKTEIPVSQTSLQGNIYRIKTIKKIQELSKETDSGNAQSTEQLTQKTAAVPMRYALYIAGNSIARRNTADEKSQIKMHAESQKKKTASEKKQDIARTKIEQNESVYDDYAINDSESLPSRKNAMPEIRTKERTITIRKAKKEEDRIVHVAARNTLHQKSERLQKESAVKRRRNEQAKNAR